MRSFCNVHENLEHCFVSGPALDKFGEQYRNNLNNYANSTINQLPTFLHVLGYKSNQK